MPANINSKAEAVAAVQRDMVVSKDSPESELPRANTNWQCFCLTYSPVPTETESFCGTEFQCWWF